MHPETVLSEMTLLAMACVWICTFEAVDEMEIGSMHIKESALPVCNAAVPSHLSACDTCIVV